MMTNEYERLKKDIGELFQNQDKKFDDLKQFFQQQMDKKLDELKEVFQQQNDKKFEKMQHEMEDLKKEQIVNNKLYENKIANLEKEVIELQEQLHTKATT